VLQLIWNCSFAIDVFQYFESAAHDTTETVVKLQAHVKS